MNSEQQAQLAALGLFKLPKVGDLKLGDVPATILECTQQVHDEFMWELRAEVVTTESDGQSFDRSFELTNLFSLAPAMADQLKAMHEALDWCMAELIVSKAKDTRSPKGFQPTKSPIWPVMEKNFELLQRIGKV